jgi:hypothetical protein
LSGLAGKARAHQGGAPYKTQLLWLAPRLAPNIRLEWKLLTLANTLAYYDMAKIIALKSFIIQALKKIL